MKKIICIIALTATGCVSHSVVRYDPSTGKRIESNKTLVVWEKSAVAGLSSKTSEKRGGDSYSRSVGLASGESQVDAAATDALTRLIGQSVLSALSGAVAPVKAP